MSGDNIIVVWDVDFVIFGVKFYVVVDVLEEVLGVLKVDVVVVFIVVGVIIEKLFMVWQGKIVCVMLNILVWVGKGVFIVSFVFGFEDVVKKVGDLFELVGVVVIVFEELYNVVIVVLGLGLVYVFLVVEVMIDVVVVLGVLCDQVS